MTTASGEVYSIEGYGLLNLVVPSRGVNWLLLTYIPHRPMLNHNLYSLRVPADNGYEYFGNPLGVTRIFKMGAAKIVPPPRRASTLISQLTTRSSPSTNEPIRPDVQAHTAVAPKPMPAYGSTDINTYQVPFCGRVPDQPLRKRAKEMSITLTGTLREGEGCSQERERTQQLTREHQTAQLEALNDLLADAKNSELMLTLLACETAAGLRGSRNRVSTSGYLFFLSGGLVSFESTLREQTTLSTLER